MPWQPITHVVDLGAVGYADVRVTVVVNPPGSLVRAYWDIIGRIAQDAPPEDWQETYYQVLARLLVRLERGEEVLDLGNPEAVRAFEEGDDPQVLALALHGLWVERERRREEAAKRFRAPDG